MKSASAPDFQTLIKRASGIIEQQQRETRRDGNEGTFTILAAVSALGSEGR
jgi:hypothetical protein